MPSMANATLRCMHYEPVCSTESLRQRVMRSWTHAVEAR
jgi:hypothetical protein